MRAAGPADFPAVAQLTLAAYRADGQLDSDGRYAAVLADVATRAADGTVLVAADPATGELLGSVTFVLPGSRYAEISGPGEAEFRMLAVHPDAQGRGVGELLIRSCAERAVRSGRRALVICTRRGFAGVAQRIYARLGFTRTPERDWSPAPGVDLMALRLDLAGADGVPVGVGSPSGGTG
ncbi:GNAT family N-acetyltransferase [Micromonospora echinofusca]|uniref:GNAT family N-acetyltransferase n=1 Tax=Micromonospora echinofusca TaxID=47858 RepID=UPI0027DDA350|nr:N-acetyltransferase [Micromonospora echinofusca]